MYMDFRVTVVIPFPKHIDLPSLLIWTHSAALSLGALVRVPLGQRELLGLVWHCEPAAEPSPQPLLPPQSPPPNGADTHKSITLRPIASVHTSVPPLGAYWRDVIAFCAQYYLRNLGEMVHIALPPALRDLTPVQLERSIARHHKRLAKNSPAPAPAALALPSLSAEQQQVMAQLGKPEQRKVCTLLFGVTGSGKTEVYMRHVATAIAQDAQAQALVLVPEINLTPQLQARFEQRFGRDAVVLLHSALSPAQRLQAWLRAHLGDAKIVLGTRLAALASMPHLRVIVVDEEHDPSYKSQDGARHSARDVAVWRGHHENIPVLLGSATPSLESWHAVQQGRYRLLTLSERIGQGRLPPLRVVDMRGMPKDTVLSPALRAAVAQRVALGEQSLLFLNRRGYAPALYCPACEWKSVCPHCSAFRVFHKVDRSLRCHHCGLHSPVPQACPSCGNMDIQMIGRGTERVEELLPHILHDLCRPDGRPVRALRMDADSSRKKGALEAQLAQVHAGDIDVIVGTQMVTKGHDFRRVTLVAALNPDGVLFNTDFRAPERLFALLMQAGGRAGRDALMAEHSELWVQTHVPQHSLFAALAKHDYASFAKTQLHERLQTAMPPFSRQALLRAEARSQEQAQAFLQLQRQRALEILADMAQGDSVTVYVPVPMSLQKIANVERAQMLVESTKRPILQAFLRQWQHTFRAGTVKGVLRWSIDMDPQEI